MKFLLTAVGLLCYAQIASAQFPASATARNATKVDIEVVQHNTEPRQFKKLLIIGSGGYVSHNIWERVCMELKDKLNEYAVTTQHEFLPSDSVQAKARYQALMKEGDFDAVLHFTADGGSTLNARKTVYYDNDFIPMGLTHTGYGYVPVPRKHTGEMSTLIAGQDWDLVLFSPTARDVIWQAWMTTQVAEAERKSYRRVSQQILAALQADQLVPTDKAHSK